MGKDGQLHNGIAQTISFPVNRNLANDVVWTVGYNTNTSGHAPLGHTSPTDSLNVGLSPAARASVTTASPTRSSGTRGPPGSPEARRSSPASSTSTGMPGPATCRLRASPFADENLPTGEVPPAMAARR